MKITRQILDDLVVKMQGKFPVRGEKYRIEHMWCGGYKFFKQSCDSGAIYNAFGVDCDNIFTAKELYWFMMGLLYTKNK